MRLRRLSPFYSPIPFSIMAEDAAVAERALEIRAGERVLCLGSSGDTTLSLLRVDPATVEAVDFSFPQICEVALKVEALRKLELQEVRILLGVERDGPEALTLYGRLRDSLPLNVASFWDNNRWMIAKGLIWQGGMHRLIRAGRQAIVFLMGRHWLDEMKALSTPEAAGMFVDRLQHHPRYELITKLLLNRFIVKSFYPEVGLLNLNRELSFRQYALQCLRSILTRRPPGSHVHLHPFLFDQYPTEDSLPPYLQRAEWDRIRSRVSRVHLTHGELRASLRSLRSNAISGFDLLNVSDWLDADAIVSLLHGLARVGTSDARLLVYSRSRRVDTRAAARVGWIVDETLSSQLMQQDRIGYYRDAFLFRLRK